MSKVANIVQIMRDTPFITIEFIWSVALILDGIYLLLPDYMPAAGSVLEQFVGSPYVSLGIAALYIVTGLIGLIGVFTQKTAVRIASTWMFFASFFFTVLIRLLTVGFVPTLWIWPLLLSLVAVIDNWTIGWKPS